MQNEPGMKWIQSFNVYKTNPTFPNTPNHPKTNNSQKEPIESSKTQETFHIPFKQESNFNESENASNRKQILYDDEFITKSEKRRKELFIVPRRAFDNKINARTKLILNSEKKYW